jgi:thioredoxin 1
MKYLLLISALVALQISSAQNYVTDKNVEESLLVTDDEVKILYFTAVWCGPCKYMSPIMKTLDENKALNLSIYKMDIDHNQTDDFLGVNSIPTFFYFKNGIKMGESRGVKREQVIEKMVAKYDKTVATGDKFTMKAPRSKYTLVAGNDAALTVENLEQIWYDVESLQQISNGILTNLDHQQDYECALILVNRSLELVQDNNALFTKAQLLHQLDRSREAKVVAKSILKTVDEDSEGAVIVKDFLKKL